MTYLERCTCTAKAQFVSTAAGNACTCAKHRLVAMRAYQQIQLALLPASDGFAQVPGRGQICADGFQLVHAVFIVLAPSPGLRSMYLLARPAVHRQFRTKSAQCCNKALLKTYACAQ